MLLAATPDLANPLPLPFGWADLVLAPATTAHLREFEVQARRRGEVLDDWGLARLTPLGRGITALFAGPSGTGKTMAAQVLARSLGLDLYRVDLAGVVNKYIGETEKHLRELFEACERAPVLLLFDEADALFGKRTQVSDAHDRFANIEIDYLLQRMEQFDGVAVLATNRKGDLDTAFIRRLRFMIDFAPPGPAERERLWRLALEDASDLAGQPLTGELDWAGARPRARPDRCRASSQWRSPRPSSPAPSAARSPSDTCSPPPIASSRSRASSSGQASWSSGERARHGGERRRRPH